MWRHSTLIILSPTARKQSLLQSRNFLILYSSQSAQLTIDRGEVSDEKVRLSISLRLAVDFLIVMYIKDKQIAVIQSNSYHFRRLPTHLDKPWIKPRKTLFTKSDWTILNRRSSEYQRGTVSTKSLRSVMSRLKFYIHGSVHRDSILIRSNEMQQ